MRNLLAQLVGKVLQSRVEKPITPQEFLELSKEMGPEFDEAVKQQYHYLKCAGDHSIYHSTPTIGSLIDVLENGIKTTPGGPRLIEYRQWKIIPIAFFSGVPQIREGVAYYGRLVVATHTDALNRPVYFKSLNYGYATGHITRVHEPLLVQMDDDYDALTSRLEYLVKLLSPQQREKLDQSQYKGDALLMDIRRIENGISSLWEKRDKLTSEVVKKLKLHPCEYVEECEAYIHDGEGLNLSHLKALAHTLHVMGSDNMEHLIFGRGKEDYAKPFDGFGVGLMGKGIERDPLANELSRQNIPFKYLTLGMYRGTLNESSYTDNLREGI